MSKIKEIVVNPNFDRLEALTLHRKMMLDKRSRIDQMLTTIDRTIQHAKGEIAMSHKEKFEGFDFSHNPYEQEARERWGDEAVDKSNAKINSMSKEEQKAMGERMNEIYRNLASLRHVSPDSAEAQAAVKEWYDFLNSGAVGHHYSLEVFRGLGQMYVDDERFRKNIDKFGEGLAVFMRDAMAVFAEQSEA